MIHQADNVAGFADEIARLADELAELGMLTMDAFKYAAEGLFGLDTELAQYALDTAGSCAAVAIDVHQKTVAILARWAPTGTDLKHLVELQRTSIEFARIAANARQVAEQAKALPSAAEQLVARLEPHASSLLASLVHQVYIALRGCLLLVISRDRGLARRIIAEDSELERLHAILFAVVSRTIERQPQHAHTLRGLVLALAALRHIGVSVVAICEDRLT